MTLGGGKVGVGEGRRKEASPGVAGRWLTSRQTFCRLLPEASRVLVIRPRVARVEKGGRLSMGGG